MTEEQWSQVESCFDELRERSPHEIAAGLAAIADEAVRAEVASLLQHTGEGETVGLAVGAMANSVGDAFRAQKIGPYRIVRKLGQGGQGTVFEAVRDDGAFDQRVAIKIVKWEIDSENTRTQFRNERQILAGLEHPHIARLLDGGETAEGAPYLVMEFVDGQPLTAAAANWRMKQKLNLFLEVAAAVAFAHRNLIVHRDLKPANILVTADGMPKLLDFGIAKLVDPNLQLTVTKFQALTPEYASPEQVRSEAITTASDVYSLGVILYELLTSRRPYAVATTSMADIHKAVCLTEPAPPRLSEDLDNILLMAMRKEPARRYSSVEQFAEDIARSMDNRPVLARKDTLRYRTGKYVRRHRFALAAAAAILLAIGAGSLVALQQARIAGQRFEQVRRLAHNFVFDYHDDLAKIQGTTAVREKMVKTALEYVDSLSVSAVADMELQKELAAAYQKVGDVQGHPGGPSLGHADQAIVSYRKAATIHERIVTRQPGHMLAAGDFYARFGSLLRLTGDLSGARLAGENSVKYLLKMSELQPEDNSIRKSLGNAWCLLGELDEDLNSTASALEKYRRCHAIAHGLLARARNVESLNAAQGASVRVGTASGTLGLLTDSLAAFDEDAKLVGELLRLEPANPRFQRYSALLAQFRSTMYYDDTGPSLNDPKRSLEYSRAYLATGRAMVARDPNDATARLTFAIALFRLSFPLKHIDPPSAVASARESVALFDTLVSEGKGTFLVTSRRARALRRLAEALPFAGQSREARVVAAQAIAEQRKVVAKNPANSQEEAMLAMALLAAVDAGEENALPEADRIASGIFERNSKELTSVILLSRVREALARNWKKAGEEQKSRHWINEARRLWIEFPDQNEYVRLRRTKF